MDPNPTWYTVANMRSFVLRHGVIVGIALLAVGSSVFFLINVLTRDPLEGLTLTTVETGIVESIVSVSGVTKSRNTAELAFPTSGVVAAVPVKEGDRVEAGTILATLGSTREVANLEKAQADLAIARAVAGKPRILFADEPTANLDSVSSEQIIALLTSLNKEQGQTIVMVTHEREYAQTADRIIYMEDGQIIKQTTPT